MAVRRGGWGPGELDTLRRMYGTMSVERLARLLGRPPETLVSRARALFRGSRRRGPWSDPEVERLCLMIGILPLEELAVVLGRTRAEVRERLEMKARTSRRGVWSPLELSLFKRIYGSRADKDVALALGRSLVSIRRLAARLCLAKDKEFLARQGLGRPMPRWTASEIERLTGLYPERTNLELAHLFGRSARSVAAKASQLGLTKCADLRARTGRENAALRADRRSLG